jgi:hypothetical protein
MSRELNVENVLYSDRAPMWWITDITIAIPLATCMMVRSIVYAIMLDIAKVTYHPNWWQIELLSHPRAKYPSIWPHVCAEIKDQSIASFSRLITHD